MTERLTENDEHRLLEYLDGRLDAAAAAEVERWLQSDPEARRLADEHRRAWALLEEAGPEPVAASETFRSRTVERARQRSPFSVRPSVAALAAASLLLALTVYAYVQPNSPWNLSPEQRVIVQHLDLLENLDYLEENAEALDIAVGVEQLSAFDGEANGEAR